MTERDAALGFMLGDCLYEDFLLVLHLAGFSTCIDSMNECCVFKIEKPNEFDGRPDFGYEYLGNFKVQGDEILLFPPDYPDNTEHIRISDLTDPKLYHKVLGYFKKPEWEIELFLDNRRHYQNFLSKAKLS